MTPTVTGIWFLDVDDYREIRVDFSNDRHHAMRVEAPYDNEAVARAFEQLTANIRRDLNLVPNCEANRAGHNDE